MKDQSFIIKIGDLINQAGRKDEMSFEKKFTDQLPDLDENGLSGDVLLQSLDKNSILVNLVNIKGTLEDNCDICQKNYKRSVFSDLYKAKFIMPDYNKDDDNGNEEIFPINHKDETINIEDMLVQAIILQEPVVRRCDDCKDKSIIDEDLDEDDLGYLEGRGNVIFR